MFSSHTSLEYLLKLSILSRHFYDTVSSEKATTGTESSTVPVLGYYCMLHISLGPNHQLLAFPHTYTRTRALYFPFPCAPSPLVIAFPLCVVSQASNDRCSPQALNP